MASMKKCKNCATKNIKTNKDCSNCGKPLYLNVRYSVAIVATIAIDIVMIVVYVLGAFLLADTTRNININNIYYSQALPVAGSVLYYALILFFIINALVKILFILNHFVLKTNVLIKLRRVFMFVEAVSMLPVQFILALYFYNVATKSLGTEEAVANS